MSILHLPLSTPLFNKSIFMKKILLVLCFVVLAGIGCVNVKTKTTDNGGAFVTDDAGAKWTAKSALPLAAGISSISGVDVTKMIVDPNDDDAIYLGTQENGLLVSYDNAESWQRIKADELRGGWINGVAVDPTNKCVVYVAKGANVMKSTDCNRTYDTQAFVETSGKTVNVVRVDWYNPSIVWLGTASGDVVKSVDTGKTWSTVARAKDDIVDIQVDNADSRIILAITARRGMWRTTDGGTTWSNMDEAFKSFRDIGVEYALSQTKDGSLIYLVSDYGILRSADHGATWEALTLLTKPGSVRIYAMAVNPVDANSIYYGTATTLYSTTDGGVNWATRQLPTSRATSVLVVDPNDTSVLYLGAATVEK